MTIETLTCPFIFAVPSTVSTSYATHRLPFCLPAPSQTMPTVDRLSLPHTLSAVANKSRRLFSRDDASTDSQNSRSSTPLRASALNLNEALEQAWVSTTSPLCLSNHLQSSPQPSVSSQSHGWGFDGGFGRRRSSNTTTASSSSANCAQEGSRQRRRKSLFSKKPRSEAPADETIEEAAQADAPRFVDPFAGQGRGEVRSAMSLRRPPGEDDRYRHSTQQIQQQQKKKKEALDRISDLVCLSVQNDAQSPQSHVGASSPSLSPASPHLSDNTYFYPVEAPPSPTSLNSSIDSTARRASIVAFPSRMDATRGLRVDMSGDAHSVPSWSSLTSPSLSFASQTPSAMHDFGFDPASESDETLWLRDGMAIQQHVLLPSSMKRQPRKEIGADINQKSFASLRAELGHGASTPGLVSRTPSDWSLNDHLRPALQPLPPLRPLRNPMRKRSKSLSSSAARQEGRQSSSRTSSPPPPVPATTASGVVEPYSLTPMHTPPRSRPGSMRRQGRCDSLLSAASSSSLQAAPFHTPTFGSRSWSTLPVS